MRKIGHVKNLLALHGTNQLTKAPKNAPQKNCPIGGDEMTEYETKKIIYETIVKEIYINPDTALELTKAIYTNLKAAEKDEPLTLTDLPRPWSTDEMKPLPYEVYKDFEQGQPFKDER